MRTKRGHGSDPRITPAIKTALISLVEEGLSIEEAAARSGLKPQTLQKSLRKPHVAAARSELRAAMRDNTRDKAFKRVAGLIDGARSEYVMLDASKHVLALAGESPATAAPVIDQRGGIAFNLILPAGDLPAEWLAGQTAPPGLRITTRPAAIEGPRDEPMTIEAPDWREKEGVYHG